MNTKSLALAFASLTMFATTGVAIAGSATAPLVVSATVAASCSISTTPVSFGAYDPASAAATTSTGSVTLSCVKNSDPSISLTLGLYAVGSVRGMKDSVITNTDVLSYQLYQPSSLVPNTACTFNETTAWGSTGTELFDPAAATSIAPQTYNICGKILPGQDVANGSYQDTVTAQVDFF